MLRSLRARLATGLPARWATGLLMALLATSAAVPARAQDEVPFITTPDAVTLAMLQLAGVGPQDHVIDLGSGDGRIVITAARRFGASGLGVEIVPALVAQSRAAAQAAGVAARVSFREQDLFATDLDRATVVTMYLLPEVNLQLRPRLLALRAGTRIVSHDWDLGDWQPDRTLTLDVPDKPIGREKLSRLHLWVVPARVGGTWCAPGLSLHLVQRFQQVSGSFEPTEGGGVRSRAPLHVFDARLDGRVLQGRLASGTVLRLLAEDGRLLLQQVQGPAAVSAGLRFQPAPASGCA